MPAEQPGLRAVRPVERGDDQDRFDSSDAQALETGSVDRSDTIQVSGNSGKNSRIACYITNDRTTRASEVGLLANDRCDRENLIAQLKDGVKALAMSVGDPVSNWAYMVIASLARSLKAWSAPV